MSSSAQTQKSYFYRRIYRFGEAFFVILLFGFLFWVLKQEYVFGGRRLEFGSIFIYITLAIWITLRFIYPPPVIKLNSDYLAATGCPLWLRYLLPVPSTINARISWRNINKVYTNLFPLPPQGSWSMRVLLVIEYKRRGRDKKFAVPAIRYIANRENLKREITQLSQKYGFQVSWQFFD